MLENNQKIPEGWSVKKISDLGTIVSGGTPDTNNPEYWDGYVLWVTPSEVSALSNRFIWDTERKITEKGLKQSSAKLLPVNSLIICTRATIGDCCINKKPICTNQGFKNIIVTGNNVDFLYYLISKNKHELIRKACGSTFLEISKKDIDNLKFPIPPLHEQEKIAEILGTWDEAIEKLSSLIEQKKLLKKGLMQKLLTGKVRLPGSTRPWKEVKLGEIFNIKKGQGLSKEVLDDNGLNKCILYGELYTKYSEVIKDIESRTNQSGGILSQIGDILIPASTTTTGIDLANATALLKENVLLGGDINILRAKKEVSSIFFAYLLTHAYKFDIAKLAQGITIVHLYGEFLKNMKVYIPSDISEQQAIANVLSTADDEIYLLNKKLMMFKEQKKGLMQQLLTGTIRVKVN